MSIRRIKVNGRKVWQARVAYRGLRTSALRDSQQAAPAKDGGEEYIQWKPLPSQFPRDKLMIATGPEWAVVGLVIWLIALDTCLVCEAEPEFIDVGYSLHESARGTTERPSQ